MRKALLLAILMAGILTVAIGNVLALDIKDVFALNEQHTIEDISQLADILCQVAKNDREMTAIRQRIATKRSGKPGDELVWKYDLLDEMLCSRFYSFTAKAKRFFQ